MRRRILIALTLALTLAGCGRVGTPQNEIVLLTEAPLARLDPRYAQMSWDTRVSRLVAPGLVGLSDRGLGDTPGLAASIVEEDPTTYVVTLRPARFSDGHPVEAQDVKYTFDSVRDPALGSPWRKNWDDIIRTVEVVDATRVRFRLRRPRAPFRNDLDFGIVSRRTAEPLDAAVRDAARRSAQPPRFDPAREVVGAGPYQVAERSADFVRLTRNPHAQTPPTADRLVVRTIRDDNSRILALLGGSADVLLNNVTPFVLETLEADPNLTVRYTPSATVTYLGFNGDDPILGRREVRQAIAMAIDRRRLITAKLRGHAEIAASFLDRENPFFAAPEPPPHDPAAARRLLDQAGFPDPDGPGPRPRFTLSWKSSNNRLRVALAQAMSRQLADVGIAVDVRQFEFATFLDDVRKGNFQMFTLQLTDLVEPDVMRAMFHSSRIPPGNPGGLNRFRYRNAQVDRWLEEASESTDQSRRKELYRQVQEALARDLPSLPLWHEHEVVVFRRTLVGVKLIKTARLEGLLPVAKTEGR